MPRVEYNLNEMAYLMFAVRYFDVSGSASPNRQKVKLA